MVIWTKHFTSFATYTTFSGSGSSGGGFISNFAPASQPAITSPVIAVAPAVGKVLGAQVFNFTKLIKQGSKGNEVIELQKFLTALGYNLGTADGKFGLKTKTALIKFQVANKLKGDGVVGPKVRLLLNK
jgi:peptidoglycan hydrolase-like protein with peptidoglycan-binding domain